MTDDQLQADVAAELSWDPKVDGKAIAVSADGGTVTLRGTVGLWTRSSTSSTSSRSAPDPLT
jgi:osmotically-inducible protein OsmY